jgi:hypothetical protein
VTNSLSFFDAQAFRILEDDGDIPIDSGVFEKKNENVMQLLLMSRDSAVCIAGRLRGQSSSAGRVMNFLLCNGYRYLFPRGVKRPGRRAVHSQLVPRSRKRGSIHPLPHTPSWHSA